MRQIVLTILLILLPGFLLAADTVYLSALHIKPSATATRFTFSLSKKTYGRVKYTPNPDRVEIEFVNTVKNFNMNNTSLGPNANVTSISTDDSQKGKLRFIFRVNGEAQWKIEFLPKLKNENVHLQLTIFTKVKPKEVKPQQIKPSSLQKSFQESALNTFAVLSNELNDRQQELEDRVQTAQHELRSRPKKPDLFVIVIDAGHGGKDPGALGKNGSMEKNIVLSIAKILARKMNAIPNVRAILTRDNDYFVPLRKRLAIARQVKADLFIAIHADAFFDKDANGASVYALSQHGATSEAARWLAKQDNYSELGGVELSSLTRDPIVRSVLVDLAQTTTLQDSIRLGNTVLDALEQISPLHHDYVERAPFVVLKSPDIPSILVETGFITSPGEERRLNSSAYQEQLANALRAGIQGYVRKYG